MSRCIRIRSSSHRPGMTLIVPLVCLGVVAALMGETLRSATRTSRQFRGERQARQIDRLLEAGVDRALRRLEGDAGYRGETWELSSEEVVGEGGGRVKITVAASADEPQPARQVRVVAHYPLDSDRKDAVQGVYALTMQRSRAFAFPLNSPPND